jgi:hypothetical protein
MEKTTNSFDSSKINFYSFNLNNKNSGTWISRESLLNELLIKHAETLKRLAEL